MSEQFVCIVCGIELYNPEFHCCVISDDDWKSKETYWRELHQLYGIHPTKGVERKEAVLDLGKEATDE